MTTHIITWQSPSGKIVTSRPLTPAAARAEIEQNQRHTPDWRYTVEPPLPDLQAMLDAANARIAELEAVCREVVEALEITGYYGDVSFAIPYIKGLNTGYTIHIDEESDAESLYDALRRLLDILPQKA